MLNKKTLSMLIIAAMFATPALAQDAGTPPVGTPPGSEIKGEIHADHHKLREDNAIVKAKREELRAAKEERAKDKKELRKDMMERHEEMMEKHKGGMHGHHMPPPGGAPGSTPVTTGAPVPAPSEQ